MNTPNQGVNRSQVAFLNYLEQAAALHPSPWRAAQNGQKWGVVASDGFRVVEDCADWAEAQAIVNYQHEEFELQA